MVSSYIVQVVHDILASWTKIRNVGNFLSDSLEIIKRKLYARFSTERDEVHDSVCRTADCL